MRIDPSFNVEVTHVNNQPVRGAVAAPVDVPIEPRMPADAARMTQGVRSQRSWPKTKFNQPAELILAPDQLRLSDAWRQRRQVADAPAMRTQEGGPSEPARSGASWGESWDKLMAQVFGPEAQASKNQERLQRAATLARQGNSRDAMRLLGRILGAEPENVSAHSLLGRLLLDDERYQEAEIHLQHAASYCPGDFALQMNLGELYYQLGENLLARQAFGQASRMQVRHSDPQAWLGMMAYEEGNLELASRNLERAVQLDPTHALARYYLAQVAFSINDPLRGNHQLQMVKQLQPSVDLRRFEQPGYSLAAGVPKPLEARRWQSPSP